MCPPKLFAEEKEARFPIKAWLDAGGDIELVSDTLVKYLAKFAEEKEAAKAQRAADTELIYNIHNPDKLKQKKIDWIVLGWIQNRRYGSGWRRLFPGEKV